MQITFLLFCCCDEKFMHAYLNPSSTSTTMSETTKNTANQIVSLCLLEYTLKLRKNARKKRNNEARLPLCVSLLLCECGNQALWHTHTHIHNKKNDISMPPPFPDTRLEEGTCVPICFFILYVIFSFSSTPMLLPHQTCKKSGVRRKDSGDTTDQFRLAQASKWFSLLAGHNQQNKNVMDF